MFFCQLDEGITKICMEFSSHGNLQLVEGRPKKGKKGLPDGLDWLCYLVGTSMRFKLLAYFCNPIINSGNALVMFELQKKIPRAVALPSAVVKTVRK